MAGWHTLFDQARAAFAQQRATPEAMRLRPSILAHPFANLKYRIFGHPRFLLRGLRGAQTEISLGVAAYNLKCLLNILGGPPAHYGPAGRLKPLPTVVTQQSRELAYSK